MDPNPDTIAAMQQDPDRWLRHAAAVEQGETQLVDLMATLSPDQILHLAETIVDIASIAEHDDSSGEMGVVALCMMEGYRRAMSSLAARAMDAT